MANFRYKRHLLQANMPQLNTFLVGATQTILAGDLLMIAVGYAVKATSGNIAGNLLGIAQEDATTTAAGDDSVVVEMVDRWSVIEGKVSGTDATKVNLWTTRYDIEDTGHTANFDDTGAGFLIPVAIPDSSINGYCDFVPAAASIWTA